MPFQVLSMQAKAKKKKSILILCHIWNRTGFPWRVQYTHATCVSLPCHLLRGLPRGSYDSLIKSPKGRGFLNKKKEGNICMQATKISQLSISKSHSNPSQIHSPFPLTNRGKFHLLNPPRPQTHLFPPPYLQSQPHQIPC